MVNGINYASCPDLWDLNFSCEMSNHATMVLELLIALAAGLCLAYLFYRRENNNMQNVTSYNEQQFDYQKRRIQLHLPDVLGEVKSIKSFFIQIRELLKRDDCWDRIDDLIKNMANSEKEGHFFTVVFSRELQVKVFKDPQLHDYLTRKLEPIKNDMILRF